MKVKTRAQHREQSKTRDAFTIVELLVVIGLIGILAAILLPSLSKARDRARAIFCVHNTGELTKAWIMYADEHNQRLAYNLSGSPSLLAGSNPKSYQNWVSGVLSWETNPDNTNTATLTESALGAYTMRAASVYRCPADFVLSVPQQKLGWDHRVRSYSMNAMIGDAGDFSKEGYNVNNPHYVQFMTMSALSGISDPSPSDLFVFIEEHPDSITDGYFLNKAYTRTWEHLPSARHNAAGSMSFADGHSELHRWASMSTRRPERPQASGVPLIIPQTELADYNWVINHMSVDRN